MNNSNFLKTWWPSLAAVAVMTVVSVAFLLVGIHLCEGHFVYPVDDTYIHIALAKNVAQHGVLGVEPGVKAFCTSSPLWTALLSLAYLVFGVSEWFPWCLSHAFNVASILIFDRLLLRKGIGSVARFLLALALAVSGPFFCTSALGMEHSMHAFFLLATLFALDADEERRPARLAWLCVFSFCAIAARYESLFFLLPLLLGVGILRRDRRMVLPLVCAVLPVLIYGVAAQATGGMFLPNSLMVKSGYQTIGALVKKGLKLFVEIPLLCEYLYSLAIALVVVVCLPGVRSFWRVAGVSAVIAIGGHLTFAMVVRQLCRYDAYLVTVGTVALLLAAMTARPGRKWFDLLRLLVPGLILSLHLGRASLEIPYLISAPEDIYSQQVQMTHIMAALPEQARGRVAINDLGYFALHSGLPIFDMVGLGTQEVATETVRHKHAGLKWSVADFAKMFDRYDVRYAVFYESWFPEKHRPDDLKPVGYLLLKSNRICGSDIVTFCARHDEDVEPLRAHLSRFADKLPPRARLVQ